MLKNFISGKYNLHNGTIKTESMAEIFSDDDYYIEKIGQIYLFNKLLTMKQISAFFKKDGNKIINLIDGMFLLVIYDKKKKVTYIFHDKSTSRLPMYYVKQGDYLFFSTSLKKILLMSKIKRKLDINSATDIYDNGVILNKKTLVCGVYKIELFHYLYISRDIVRQSLIEYTDQTEMTEKEAMKKWNDVFLKIVLKNIDNSSDTIAMPLSSGYDSNYILFMLSEKTNKKIKAFTVGGIKSNNEINDAKNIVKNYPNTTFFSEVVSPDNLKNYPEMVWRLEGSVLECGIALQYVLAKIIASQKVDKVICGECADEVMNEEYFKVSAAKYEADKKVIKNLDYQTTPFYITNLLVLKKSSIMFNSFGIETVYPYKDTNFINLAKAMKNINKNSKQFHKENCQNLFPKNVTRMIKNIGGATEFIDLLTKEDFLEIKERIKNCDHTKYFSRTMSFSFEKFDIETVEKLMKFLYILLFVELFITGKYDDAFENETLPDNLFDKLNS